eukprot:jgi/Chlat1/6184/Chrsp42S05738
MRPNTNTQLFHLQVVYEKFAPRELPAFCLRPLPLHSTYTNNHKSTSPSSPKQQSHTRLPAIAVTGPGAPYAHTYNHSNNNNIHNYSNKPTLPRIPGASPRGEGGQYQYDESYVGDEEEEEGGRGLVGSKSLRERRKRQVKTSAALAGAIAAYSASMVAGMKRARTHTHTYTYDSHPVSPVHKRANANSNNNSGGVHTSPFLRARSLDMRVGRSDIPGGASISGSGSVSAYQKGRKQPLSSTWAPRSSISPRKEPISAALPISRPSLTILFKHSMPAEREKLLAAVISDRSGGTDEAEIERALACVAQISVPEQMSAARLFLRGGMYFSAIRAAYASPEGLQSILNDIKAIILTTSSSTPNNTKQQTQQHGGDVGYVGYDTHTQHPPQTQHPHPQHPQQTQYTLQPWQHPEHDAWCWSSPDRSLFCARFRGAVPVVGEYERARERLMGLGQQGR